MAKTHQYTVNLKWTGNQGSGTASYKSYSRDHSIETENKATIECSSDPAFRGNPNKYNPEELFLAALANCHMLWYLHLCSTEGIVVVNYQDEPVGIMFEKKDGSGNFTEVILKPQVEIAEESMIEKSLTIHEKAHKMCFIANSVNFPVKHEPVSFLYKV